MLLGSWSRHNKDLEQRTLKPPRRVTALGSWTNRIIALRQISGTALFYLEESRRIHPRRRGEWKSAPACGVVGDGGERESACVHSTHVGERGLFFLCFFLPPGPAPCKLGLGRSAVLPEVLTQVLGPLTFLCSIFLGFSLPCLSAPAILDSFSLF